MPMRCWKNSNFKSAECGTCVVSYYDGEQIGLPSNFEQKPQTKEDRIRAEIATDEGLAGLLVHWEDDWGEYSTPIGHIENYEEAITKTVEWLKQPAEE